MKGEVWPRTWIYGSGLFVCLYCLLERMVDGERSLCAVVAFGDLVCYMIKDQKEDGVVMM